MVEEKTKIGKGKISLDMLSSPGGMIFVLIILIQEIVDIAAPSGTLIGDVIAIILEVVGILWGIFIMGSSLKSMLLPIIIERIPILSLLPSWLIWLIRNL